MIEMWNKLLLPFLCVFVLILGGCDRSQQALPDHSIHPPQVESAQLEPLSPTFIREDKIITGNEDRMGILGPELIAGEGSKQMWLFWGNEEEFPIHLTIRVIGLNLTTNEVSPVLLPPITMGSVDSSTQIWELGGLGGSNHGARHHKPSNIQINEPGRWKIFVFFNDKLFDSIVVDVKEPK